MRFIIDHPYIQRPERAQAAAMGLILALVITVIVLAIGCVGIIGLIRWTRDPTMAKRLPGFNIFTGNWSDEKAVKDQRSDGESNHWLPG